MKCSSPKISGLSSEDAASPAKPGTEKSIVSPPEAGVCAAPPRRLRRRGP
jgi:hypothetical protein